MSPIEEVRAKVLAALDDPPLGTFAWVTDAVCGEPWGYWVHVGWVQDWNEEGRATPSDEFLRAWIAEDENIEKALAASRGDK